MLKTGVHIRGLALGAAAAVAVAVLGGGVALAADASKRGGTLKTYTPTYRSLNPAVQSGFATGTPGSQLFAGLLLIDRNFEPQPYLAESWKISDDGLKYTFHLVEDATFHDGEPITAEDIAYSLDVVKNNHPFGPAMFGNVEAVGTPDDHTAVIQLEKPTPGLMLSLQPLLMPVLPKHVYDDGQDISTHPRNMQNVVGSGPFELVENDPSRRIVMERNGDFFLDGKPYLDKIVFRLVKDPLTRSLLLKKGQLDLAGFSGLRPREVARLEENESINVTTEGYDAIGFIHYLEMNLREPPFDDTRVRRAIAHAIDVEFIADVLFQGRAEVGTGPLHTGNPFYTDDVRTYPVDLEKARALLDEAGYPPGEDGTRFTVTVDVPTWAQQTHNPIAEYLRPQLEKVGIQVELRRAPDFSTWSTRVSSFDYEATINGSFNYPDPTIGVHRHFLCSNIRNVIWSNTQGYCNEEVDEILKAAAVEMDREKRQELYTRLQQKITEDAVFVYLPQEYTTTVFRERVENPPLSAFGPMAPWHRIHLSEQ